MGLPKILICGEGRSGKDTACEYLAKITTLRNAGTTSKYLCKYVAEKLGLSEEEAYARRHESDEMRTVWYNYGNELRLNGPSTLARIALANGEISGGIRDYDEAIACKKENVADILIWIKNPRVPKDPTMKFGEEQCDITILNSGTLQEFYDRLRRFAIFANLPLHERIKKNRFKYVKVNELGGEGPHRRYEKFEPELELSAINHMNVKVSEIKLASGVSEKGRMYYQMYEKRFGKEKEA